uniref:Uncharacterized protein n=1 Tax=Aegilops tauschii subsp. strangulata TaxID=200361 RepID=A0A453HDE9_AEGTS
MATIIWNWKTTVIWKATRHLARKQRKLKSRGPLPLLLVQRRNGSNKRVQAYGKHNGCLAGSTSVTSSTDVPRGHGIKDVIKLAGQSGAKECSDLFFTVTKLFMNVDYREMFSALETNEGRLNWLNMMHE